MTPRPRILLISLQNTLIDFGVRYIAASCRTRSIDVRVLFCPREPWNPESEQDLGTIAKWVKSGGYTLIGFSLMSIHVGRAIRMTRAIRSQSSSAIVWGGIHPILRPERCLEHADFICAADGEKSIPILVQELADGRNHPSIANIYYKKNGTIIRNPLEIPNDLDAVPFPDYELESHFVSHNGKIVDLNETKMRDFAPWNLGRYYLITSRGCPYHCTYCCNSALQKIFGQQSSLRIRSVANVLKEIQDIRTRFPFLKQFAIMDDSFFFKPGGWVEDFCAGFKETGARFGVLMHPKTVTFERVEELIDAGLIGVQMGLQSGSERISRDLYQRPETVDEFIRAASVLDKFRHRLIARTYDVILDNPYESEDEQAQTIRVLAGLNKPFLLDVFSLTFYPGTELFEHAVRDGLLKDDDQTFEDKNYLDVKPTMLNRLTWLTHSTPSRIVLFFLDHRRNPSVRLLFTLYCVFWESGLRVFLRRFKQVIRRLISCRKTGR